MAQEITLPVKLQIENLQNITKEMRSQLGTLKVDSSGYKKLENVIIDIEKRIQQLQVISSRPFVDTKQFTAVSKEIIGIQDDLTKVRIEAGKVKFSDLQLDASQKAKLQELDTQIKSINDQLKQVKDSAKNTFFETDIGKAWKLNHADDVGKTFTQITKIIEGEVAKQEKALHDAEQAQTDYQERLAARRKLSSFMKNGHGLTKENLGEDIYNSIFDKNGNFKSGGKTALQTWLEEQFKLDHNVVQSLTDQAGKKVREAFENTKGEVDRALKQERTRINSSLTEESNRTNKGQTYAQDIVAAQASLDAAKATKEGLSQTNIKLAKTEEDLSDTLRKAKLDREAYMQAVTRVAAEQLQMGSSCDKARAQLDSLNHTIDTGKAKLASLDQATSKLQGISNFVNRYVGAYAIIRKVSTAIRNAFNNIKELDKTITSIAVVTNMSQEDLWNKVGQYTQMAQEYGVTTNDVYKVSQLFYQQGLQTTQVMSLTTETLKMAKIAGMDYTQATNAMTVAVRAFNIEMDQAQQVTDTYSALAAKFAVSSAEIANAMEKTASSAANVGMSIQSTSAFMSVMIQTTRESAQNIGSALKSIISRYGEMKASPASLINVDGEEVAFNKVDTALKSVGISIKDASGQFRDFDDVIMELAAKWNTLDNNTQRYIATVMAGNRQQSRFIALVSNYDELSRAMNVASNAENASIVQVAKTMDSLESKANQLKNAFSQLYLDLHIESGLKNIYDWLTRIITTVGKLGTLSGAIPTLMNIFGFGSGTKKIFNEISNSIQQKKLTIETDNSQFQKEKEEIEAYLANPHELNITTKVDDTQLTNVLNVSASLTTQSLTNSLQRALGDNYNDQKLGLIYEAYKNGSLSTIEGRKDLLENKDKLGLSPDNPEYNNINNFLEQLGLTTNALRTLGQAVEEGSNAEKNNAQSKEENTVATQGEGEAKTEQTTSTRQVTDAEIELAQKTGVSASELELLKDKQASARAAAELQTQADEEKVLHARNAGQADEEKVPPAKAAAEADRKKASAGGSGWSSHPLAMKITGIATGAARMLGTAITATGAAHQNQVGESFLGYSGTNGNGVELSKMYTGLGNGLSMAGTGASMLTTLGPWGAAIGAIGGFLIGGLGALIDGATMTLEEQLAIEKEAAKKASDDALKASAKSADLSNQIDNIKQLQKAMYNSTEDMQAYKDAMNTMASEYPALVSTYDEAGNAIIDLKQAEVTLMQTRLTASIAANQAAKAEAQTRKTTIDILHEAQNTITAGTNRVGTTLKDKSGKVQSFYDNNTWWQIVESAQNEGNNVTNWTLNDYIDYLNAYSGNNGMVKNWKQKFENVSIANNGEISLGDLEYRDKSGIKEYKKANEVLKNHATDLNITKASDVDEDMAYIYGFMGWDKTIELTAERVEEFEERLSARVQGYEKLVATLDEQLPIVDAQESLDYALLDEDTEKAAKISTSKIAAKLIANQLTIAAKEKNLTAGQWSRTENEQLASEYEGVKTLATDAVVEWLTGLSNDALDKTLAAFSSMSSYRSLDDLLKTLGFDDINNFIDNSGLDHDTADKLIKGWQQSFIDANKANRDRIINTIYSNNGQGWELNNELKGLAKFTNQNNNSNFALDIAYKFKIFDGQSKIISDYADYFTTQLLDINELAEKGYTELAHTRLTALASMADALGDINNSKQQQELFNIITTTDFTSYESLQNSIKSISDYATKNNISLEDDAIGPLKDLYDTLVEASNNLIFNVNTLAQEVTDKITTAAKKMDSIAAMNKSGLSFDKALEEYESLAATLGTDTKFDTLFTFDASLNKYVYTRDGLQAAIEQSQSKLQTSVDQLNTTNTNYINFLNAIPDFSNAKNTEIENADKLNAILSHYHIPKELSQYQEQLVNSFFADETIEHTLSSFQDYINQQIESGNIEAEKAQQLLANYNNNLINQYYQAIDWSSLALNTDYYGTNQTLMEELAKELQLEGEQTWETVSQAYLDTIKDPAARAAAETSLKEPIIQDQISQYQSAISEILSFETEHYLSQATYQLLDKAGTNIVEIGESADTAVAAASKFLSLLAEQIGKGGYTLEQYNQDAASILEKTIANETRGKTLLDFASEDNIGVSQLEGLANTLGVQLNELINVTTNEFTDEVLGQYLQFDKYTSTYKVKGSFTKFVDALNTKYGGIIDTQSKQYIDAVSAFNDAQISESTRIQKGVSDELNKIVSSKGGEQLNLATTFTQLRGKMSEEFINGLTELGAIFNEDGILTLAEGANIPAIVQELADLAAKNAALIPSDMEALSDAIQDLLSSITDNITSGISGKLSNSGARNLQQWAKNNNLGELNFTRTKNGLKLSTEEATKLYEELRKIDTISAEIVLDALNESLEESVTRAGALKDEIASIRATTESDDFKFMDKDIPSGQNNPLNYFENWTKAFKALDEASKGTGRDKNKIAYQDYYNIITEMSNLAATSGQTFQLGKNFEVNASNAAELIERGAAALSVASDGTLKVDLSQLGIDFATGASNLKQDVGKGIQEVARSQIEMLDSMIQLLETIVAMEDLGDLANEGEGDKNVIEIDDILPELKIDSNGKITQIGEFSQAYTKWRDGILHQIKEINEDGSKNSDFNKDLADAMKAIKIGDFSFEEILGFSPSDLASKGEDFMKQYSAVLNSFWKAAQSGDYDLNNLFSSIREVLAGSGFEGEISIGDMKLIGKYNTVLMMDKDGNITTDDGTEFKGTNAFENAARYQKARDLDILKDASTTWNEETQSVDIKDSIITNVSYDLSHEQYTLTFADGTTAIANSTEAANLAIATYANMIGEDIGTGNIDGGKPIQFTISKEGMMDIDFEIVDGEIKITQSGMGSENNQAQAEEAVNKALEAKQKELDTATQSASDQTLESNIDNLNLQLSTDATATVDISDIQITTTGTPQPVELTPTPDFKLGEDADVKVNVDNITPKSEGKLNPFTYDQLDATITTINAIYDQIPNKDQVNLHEIKYDTLQAAIKEVQAKFNGKPNIDGITLEEPTYSKMLGILLASIYLTRAEESSIDSTGITIGDNEVEIADIINALLTGELVLNGTDVPAIAGTITLADGTVVPIDSIKAEIAQVIFELAEGTSLDLDFEALGLKTEYEAPEAVVTQHIEVNYVYDENDPIGTLNRLRGIDNGIHDKVYSETFGRYIEDNFSLMDMGEGSDSFTFNVGGSFNIQDVELPEGWNLDEGSGLLTTTSEYYIPTQLRIEQNEIDDSSLDDLQDKYEQLEEPVTAQVEIEDLTGEEFEEILNNQQAIEDKSPTEVVISQDVQQNDETKKQLDDINELEQAIQDKSQQEIKLAAPEAPGVAEQLGAVAEAANSIPTDIGINVTISTSGSLPSLGGKGGGGGTSYVMPRATGNVGLANAKGTLMGELGPELVVSNGRYFVAGQSGAEFVDLDTDAIVFNHLQTEQLLKHGMSKQRGQAVTNERNAVSFATGNVHGGPAMASAKAALAALKQLRAQWKAIQDMGTKDLAGLGGSGNGGGGGNKKSDPKAFLKQLEIWYNWLQRIAVLEEKINYEEAKRNEIASSFAPSGKAYVDSQKETLDYLKEEAAVQLSLVKSQQEYFEQRRAEMNSANNPFSALYTFDEYGQLKYKDGALEQLSQLVNRDSLTGKANMTAEEQYNRLVSMGYGKYMEYDNSGNAIDKEQDDWYVSAVQAFWDKIDSDKEEMQSLHDSIEEHKKAVLEQEQKMNEILQEIEDNQIEVENKMLKAYIETRQRAIDELQKERDALEEAANHLIDGLSDQLQKERDMYSRNEGQTELTSLQRQLAILQRSGGSAAQIASLQKEISQKQQDAYFEAQQAEIDALQEASDKQIEKLDNEIELMTEQLEYEKLHGMLWQQIYDYMTTMSAKEIAQYIADNTEEYWGKSETDLAKTVRGDLFESEKYKEVAGGPLGSIEKAALIYSEKAVEEEAAKKRKEEEEAKAKAAAAQTSQSSGSGSSSSSGSSGASTPTSSKDNNNNNNNNKVSDVNGYSYSYTYGNQKRSDVINTSNPVVALAAAAKEITDATKREQQNSKGIQGMLSTAVNYAKAVTSLKIDKITNGKKQASGGYVGHGIYELGELGTETVLTAEQTQVLRNNILSNRPNSLISLLKSYNESYDGIGNTMNGISQVEDNSMVIEHIEMNMNVSKIADDYDAKRAGEQALQKMVEIARKTQAQNRIGR